MKLHDWQVYCLAFLALLALTLGFMFGVPALSRFLLTL